MTNKKIVDALRCCHCAPGEDCEKCPIDNEKDCKNLEVYAADLIERLEDENERLHYTLQGVMHFVDKWIDKEPSYCDIEDADGSIAVHRAAEAREIALRAIEKVERERDAAVNAIRQNRKTLVQRFRENNGDNDNE